VLLGSGGGAETFLNKRISFGPNQLATQTIALVSPLLDQFAYPAEGTGATDVATYWTSAGEYISDQIKIGSNVHLSVGTRHDAIKIHGSNKLSVALTQFNNKFDVWTKQAGLVYDVSPAVSAYGSWSQSLKPGSNLAYDSSGNSGFPPESGEQFEGGLKFQNAAKNLNVTVASYVITRANVVVPSGTAKPESVGATETRAALAAGVEPPTSCAHDLMSRSAAGSTPTSSAVDASVAETRTLAVDRTTGKACAPGATDAYAAVPCTSSGRSRVEPVVTTASRGTAKAAWSIAPCCSVDR